MRSLRLGLIVTVLLLSLVGFAFAAGEQEQQSNDGEVTLELWTYFTSDWVNGAAFFDAIDRFNEEYDNITVEIQSIPFDQLKNQVIVASSGGQLPDVLQMDSTDHASFSALGILEDITDRAESELNLDGVYEGPLDSARYDGSLYGLPIDANAIALIYNEDMLSEAGYDRPPETWDELREYAATISEEFGPGVYGFENPAVRSEVGTFQFMPFIWMAGGDYDNLDSEGTIAALQLYKDLVDSGAMSPEVFNWNQADVYNQFETQRVAMYVEGPWRIPDLQSIEDFNWGIAPLPAPEGRETATVLGGENLAIIDNGDPAKVDAAFELLKFFYRDDVML